jgi:cobalt-precorrin 5A hydrolase
MGQETVGGYECKPKDFDPNRPIMHYQYQIYICDDKRCAKAAKYDKAKELRDLLKSMELNQGKNRIKISKSKCFGACRYRQVAQINANTQANGLSQNSALWLKHTHNYTLKKWEEIFLMLKADKILTDELDSDDFIKMKVYE